MVSESQIFSPSVGHDIFVVCRVKMSLFSDSLVGLVVRIFPVFFQAGGHFMPINHRVKRSLFCSVGRLAMFSGFSFSRHQSVMVFLPFIE